MYRRSPFELSSGARAVARQSFQHPKLAPRVTVMLRTRRVKPVNGAAEVSGMQRPMAETMSARSSRPRPARSGPGEILILRETGCGATFSFRQCCALRAEGATSNSGVLGSQAGRNHHPRAR